MFVTERRVSSLRIYGGKHHRREIRFLPNEGIRPTGSRVRKVLFDWLRPVISKKDCLDLFSGSGILAFEALSQGANHVVCIDHNRAICDNIQSEATRLREKDIEVKCQSIPSALNAAFDIVFMDPPFDQLDRVPDILAELEAQAIFSPSAYLYIEANKKLEVLKPWKIEKCKQVGDVYMHLWVRDIS